MSPLKSPIIAVSMALVTTLAACTRQDPPTLTPAPTALTTEGVPLTNGQPIIITTTLFALNFIGDGLRDALDPKDR